jgi:hypothetical protein
METKYEELITDIDEEEFNVLRKLIVIPRELLKAFRKRICKYRIV